MSIQFSTGLRNALLGQNGFQKTFQNGIIYLYSGPQPLNADAAVQGTLLGKVTLNGGSFAWGSATNGLNFDTPASGVLVKVPADTWKFVGLADGVLGWFRLMGNAEDNLSASTTLPRMDGTIANSGGDLNVSTTNVKLGSPSTIDVFQLTMPAA